MKRGEPGGLEPFSSYLKILSIKLVEMIIQALMTCGGSQQLEGLKLAPGCLCKFRSVLKLSRAPERWPSLWLCPGVSESILQSRGEVHCADQSFSASLSHLDAADEKTFKPQEVKRPL